jgi:hypothetical protein
MANDESVAMVEFLRVLRMQAGAILKKRTIHDDDNPPRQAFEGLQGFREPFGLSLREALQRIDREVRMILQKVGELRLMKS